MGTKRRIAEWWVRSKGEYVVAPAGWKPRDGEIVFTEKKDMLGFARAARLILRERPNGRKTA